MFLFVPFFITCPPLSLLLKCFFFCSKDPSLDNSFAYIRLALLWEILLTETVFSSYLRIPSGTFPIPYRGSHGHWKYLLNVSLFPSVLCLITQISNWSKFLALPTNSQCYSSPCDSWLSSTSIWDFKISINCFKIFDIFN